MAGREREWPEIHDNYPCKSIHACHYNLLVSFFLFCLQFTVCLVCNGIYDTIGARCFVNFYRIFRDKRTINREDRTFVFCTTVSFRFVSFYYNSRIYDRTGGVLFQNFLVGAVEFLVE